MPKDHDASVTSRPMVWRPSLGVVLAICLSGIQLAAVSLVIFSSYVTSERALLDHARNLMRDVAVNAIEHSKGFLEPAKGAAELATRLAENRIVASDNRQLLEKLLFQQLQTAPQFGGLFYGDEAGNFTYVMRSDGPGPFRSKLIERADDQRATELIWRNDAYQVVSQRADPEDTFDPRTRPWYNKAKSSGTTVWTDPYIFFSSQQPGITVSSPVLDSLSGLKGVVGVDIEIDEISGFLSRLHIGENGVAMILNRNGDVIAHPDSDLIRIADGAGGLRFVSIDEINDPIARTAFGHLVRSGEIAINRPTNAEFEFDGGLYVSTVMPIISEALPWTIAVYAPESDFTRPIAENRTRNIWVAALITLATACLGIVLANQIYKPVRAFAVRSALVSQGEISPSEPMPKTYRELDRANETLVHEIAQRKKSEHEYGRMFELASRGMAQISPRGGDFIRINAQFAAILGYETDDMLSMSLPDILDDRETGRQTLNDIIRGDAEFLQELRCRRKDGAAIWLRMNAILIRDEEEHPLYAVLTMDDVTERLESEAKIKQLSRDLAHFARLNTMGQMAAGLAHELNQPLAALSQNVDTALLTAAQADGDRAELVEILEEVNAQAYRAADIIRALRAFVRKDDGSKQAFDMTELLDQAFQLVKPEAREHNITLSWHADDIPKVIGTRIQIAQVLVNLLRNAIEAISGSDVLHRRIEVWAINRDGLVEIQVEDSGPGVDPDIRLFGQFETTKADGMGLGLSISRSMIEANGGKLWYHIGDCKRPQFRFTVPSTAS